MSDLKISIVEPVGGHGGMDFYDYGLARGLSDQGAQVYLYTCSATTVQQLNNVQTKTYFKDLWNRNKIVRAFLFFRGYIRAFRDSKKNNVQVVHFQFFLIRWINLIVLLFARFYKFKKVLTIHDVDPLVNTAPNFLHTWIYKLVDEVIVHNDFSASELRKKKIRPEKIHVVPHGNYLDSCNPLPPKQNEDQFNLLFFGQIKEEKGLDILLSAMKIVCAKNKNITLTIAGRPWRMDLKALSAQISATGLLENIKTHFRYIRNEEVPSFFKNADLIVLPYKRIYQSGVLLMTMSYGRPVLVSDLAPMLEIIKNKENGFTFKTGIADNLAEKILDLYAHRKQLDEAAQQALVDISEKYDWGQVAKKTIDVYTI